jgi:hypothetical protein
MDQISFTEDVRLRLIIREGSGRTASAAPSASRPTRTAAPSSRQTLSTFVGGLIKGDPQEANWPMRESEALSSRKLEARPRPKQPPLPREWNKRVKPTKFDSHLNVLPAQPRPQSKHSDSGQHQCVGRRLGSRWPRHIEADIINQDLVGTPVGGFKTAKDDLQWLANH